MGCVSLSVVEPGSIVNGASPPSCYHSNHDSWSSPTPPSTRFENKYSITILSATLACFNIYLEINTVWQPLFDQCCRFWPSTQLKVAQNINTVCDIAKISLNIPLPLTCILNLFKPNKKPSMFWFGSTPPSFCKMSKLKQTKFSKSLDSGDPPSPHGKCPTFQEWNNIQMHPTLFLFLELDEKAAE